MMRRWLEIVSLLAALSLLVAACSNSNDQSSTAASPPGPESPTTTTDTATTAVAVTTTLDAGSGVAFDVGVTPAPCPEAVNSENGCIYLGVISNLDLNDGPLASVAIPLTQAQEDFWRAVNEGGGISGFDVIISAQNTFDARYDEERTAEGASILSDRVLGLAQSLGTAQTQAALPIYAENNMVVVPATRWSGWTFAEEDGSLVMESGASLCFEAMNGMSFLALENGTDFSWALVAFPSDLGDYGDYGAGAKLGAALLGLADPVVEVSQTPVSLGGDVVETVATLAAASPDVVVMVTGPTEMAQVAAGLSEAGHEFRILGSSSTWSVTLKGDPAVAPLLEAVYFATSAWGAWDFDSAGHTAMRAAAQAADRGPHPAYVAGWIWQYPWVTLLTEAIATGDITRENVAAVAEDLDGIDYEGMLPAGSYAGTANESAARRTIVNRADANASDGLSAVTDAFVSEITADYNIGAPCSDGS